MGYWEKREQQRREMKRLYKLPANRRLKHIALAVIAIPIILLFSIVFCGDNMSWRAMAIIRVFAGLGALAFAILYIILNYRVYNDYIHQRRSPKL